MKRHFYLSAMLMATLALGGCSQDEVISESPNAGPQAIEFGTYMGNAPQGRGQIMDDAMLKADGFGITAFYTKGENNAWGANGTSMKPNFMWNQKVTYNGSVSAPSDGSTYSQWEYTPLKYWPTMTNDKLSFFAYAPYSEQPTSGTNYPDGIKLSTINDDGTPTVTFTVANKVEDMVDFVATNAIDEQHAQTGNTNDANKRTTVNFVFQHELTRLNFLAKVDETVFETSNKAKQTYVVIKEAQLDGKDNGKFYQSAKYTFNNADMSTTVRGSWSYVGATYMPTTGYKIGNIMDVVDLKATIGDTYTTKGIALEGTTAVPLFKQNPVVGSENKNDPDYLFLIPVSAKKPSDDATGTFGLAVKTASVTFKYDIVTKDSKLPNGYSCTEAEKTVYLPAGIMQQGVAYNITFTFYVDAIEVTASVAGWDETGIEDVNIPYSPDDATVSTPSEP